jgi:microcystin-dependent protein
MSYRSSLPAGIYEPFGGIVAPNGYMICDGSAVDRVLYAALFANIGENYGAGDGSTTFNLPDMRGYFPRGWNNGAGNDPDAASRYALYSGGNSGDAVGSYQFHQFYSHVHTLPPFYNGGGGTSGSTIFGATGVFLGEPATQANGGNETRPINVYANYIIKY